MLRLREGSGEGSLPTPGPSSRCRIGTQGNIDSFFVRGRP